MDGFSLVMFVFQFFVVITMFGLKLFNIFEKGRFLDIKFVFMTFIAFILFYGVGFAVMISSYNDMLFATLFKLESWLLPLFGLFFFIEIALFFVEQRASSVIKAYKSREV